VARSHDEQLRAVKEEIEDNICVVTQQYGKPLGVMDGPCSLRVSVKSWRSKLRGAPMFRPGYKMRERAVGNACSINTSRTAYICTR
jgi:hypothetical protein